MKPTVILMNSLALLILATTAKAQQTTKSDLTPGLVIGTTLDLSSRENMKPKEISKEVTVPKNGAIYIENMHRSVQVKTWDQQKVKVTATVFCEEGNKLTDDEWFDKLNLSLKTIGTSVKLKYGSLGDGAYSLGTARTLGVSDVSTVFNESSEHIGTGLRLVVYVPAGSKLDIESKYGGVQLPANTGDVHLDISNGTLEAENLNKLNLRSKYSSVNIGDVKTAEVEFVNGRFSAGNINDLDIDTKYSTVDLASAKKVLIRSVNDEYEMEEVDEIRGRKNFGNLRITKLNHSIELEGANADIKIRKLSPDASLIKLDDRYADIRVPLREVKNYSINFSGPFSSVYGNFEKKAIVTQPTDKADLKEKTVTGYTISSANSTSNKMAQGGVSYAPPASVIGVVTSGNFFDTTIDNPPKFTASAGDGKGLKLDIKCQNCTVDFK